MPEKGLAAAQSFFRRVAFRRREPFPWAPESKSGPVETRPRSFHVLCSEQDACAFRFRLVAREPQLMCGAKGARIPTETSRITQPISLKKRKMSLICGPNVFPTDCRGSGLAVLPVCRPVPLLLLIRRVLAAFRLQIPDAGAPEDRTSLSDSDLRDLAPQPRRGILLR